MCDLFTEGSHNRRTTVAIVFQDLFPSRSKTAVKQRMNSDVFLLFNTLTNREQIQTLGQTMDPGKSGELLSVYKTTVTNRPNGYLVIDCSSGKAKATCHDA